LTDNQPAIRHDWSLREIREIHDLPLLELVFRAGTVHRQHHDPREVQVCKLISIKTGACPEDCKYCSQSVRYQTEVEPTPLMPTEDVVETARRAKAAGITRVCMGAAWRGPKDNADFDHVLDMVKQVNDMGVEVCCTLGLLREDQAKRLDDAGLYAYNHNLDTSETFYGKIISTRKFADRIRTIENVQQTSVTVCSGGIIGMGEKTDDRLAMLQTLAAFDPHPASVPINVLSKVDGTPLEEAGDVPWDDVTRMIATTRILMPRATVRLSAGRAHMSDSEQAICFMAGANSIFSSETGQMLTKAVPSPDYDQDKALLAKLGLTMRPPFKDGKPQPGVREEQTAGAV
jgi:biotin synthase